MPKQTKKQQKNAAPREHLNGGAAPPITESVPPPPLSRSTRLGRKEAAPQAAPETSAAAAGWTERLRAFKEASPDVIKYGETITEDRYVAAVAEARQILADIDSSKQKRIGELADQVQKVYGEKRSKRFADDIGIAVCTVERYRSVFRAWQTEDKTAPEPLFYSVAKALQAAPDRFELIRQNPQMTKAEAHKIMRARRVPASATPADPAVKETQRWFKAVVERAGKILRDAEFVNGTVEPELRERLREGTERKLLPTLREAGSALIKLADFLEQLADSDSEADSEEEAEPREPLLDAAE